MSRSDSAASGREKERIEAIIDRFATAIDNHLQWIRVSSDICAKNRENTVRRSLLARRSRNGVRRNRSNNQAIRKSKRSSICSNVSIFGSDASLRLGRRDSVEFFSSTENDAMRRRIGFFDSRRGRSSTQAQRTASTVFRFSCPSSSSTNPRRFCRRQCIEYDVSRGSRLARDER